MWATVTLLAVALFSVAFVWSQRQHLYLSSENAEIRWHEFMNVLRKDEVTQSNNFIYGTGLVLANEHAGRYTWGREIAVNLFVRPIPRQFWPTRYEDVGATWVNSEYPGLGSLTPMEWLATVGWVPFAGSSAMSISDLHGEFGWGVVLAMYLIGLGFAELRLRRRTRGGLWQLLYLEALMLSLYLATQSFSAFYHRFLVLAVPTVLDLEVADRAPCAGVPFVRQPPVSGGGHAERCPTRFDRSMSSPQCSRRDAVRVPAPACWWHRSVRGAAMPCRARSPPPDASTRW